VVVLGPSSVLVLIPLIRGRSRPPSSVLVLVSLTRGRPRPPHSCSSSSPSSVVVPAVTMGLLFSKIWSLFNDEEHKIIVVGLDNAGKTTILYQLLMNEVVHTSPTIGSNVEEIVWKNIRFLMWDIGGQEKIRKDWYTYYTHTEFVIIVVDSTDRERLPVTKEELSNMLRHDELKKAAVLIFANKQDIKGCMTAAEISNELSLTNIKDHRWQIQSCCALTGEGLYQGMEWIVSNIKRK